MYSGAGLDAVHDVGLEDKGREVPAPMATEQVVGHRLGGGDRRYAAVLRLERGDGVEPRRERREERLSFASEVRGVGRPQGQRGQPSPLVPPRASSWGRTKGAGLACWPGGRADSARRSPCAPGLGDAGLDRVHECVVADAVLHDELGLTHLLGDAGAGLVRVRVGVGLLRIDDTCTYRPPIWERTFAYWFSAPTARSTPEVAAVVPPQPASTIGPASAAVSRVAPDRGGAGGCGFAWRAQ